jgi:hypothetical protein
MVGVVCDPGLTIVCIILTASVAVLCAVMCSALYAQLKLHCKWRGQSK